MLAVDAPNVRLLPRFSGLLVTLTCAVVFLSASACSDDPATPDTDTKVNDTSADTDQDDATGVDVEEDAGPPKYLRWAQHIPSHGKKLRAIAQTDKTSGHYVLVGDGASVVRHDNGTWDDISLTTVSGADLHGVYVDPKGKIVVAGDKSALAIYEEGSWVVAGEVPPTPAVNFLAVNGTGDEYWAVGADAAAWHFFDAAWAPAAVTVTDGEGIGAGAKFVSVAVTKDEVWIACDRGEKSPGLALRKTAKGWKSYPLTTSPRDIWIAPDKVDGGVLVAGGTSSEYVARFDGKAFVAESNLKWTQGFHALAGLAADDVWVAGFKGQLRRSGKTGWDVVSVEAPPGTPKPFPPPTSDLVDIAAQGPEELAVITNYRMYRFGKQ